MPEPMTQPPLTARGISKGGRSATVRRKRVNGAVVSMTGTTKMHNDQDIPQP